MCVWSIFILCLCNSLSFLKRVPTWALNLEHLNPGENHLHNFVTDKPRIMWRGGQRHCLGRNGLQPDASWRLDQVLSSKAALYFSCGSRELLPGHHSCQGDLRHYTRSAPQTMDNWPEYAEILGRKNPSRKQSVCLESEHNGAHQAPLPGQIRQYEVEGKAQAFHLWCRQILLWNQRISSQTFPLCHKQVLHAVGSKWAIQAAEASGIGARWQGAQVWNHMQWYWHLRHCLAVGHWCCQWRVWSASSICRYIYKYSITHVHSCSCTCMPAKLRTLSSTFCLARSISPYVMYFQQKLTTKRGNISSKRTVLSTSSMMSGSSHWNGATATDARCNMPSIGTQWLWTSSCQGPLARI